MGQRHQIYFVIPEHYENNENINQTERYNSFLKEEGIKGKNRNFFGFHDQWLYDIFAIKSLAQLVQFQKTCNKYSCFGKNTLLEEQAKLKMLYSMRIEKDNSLIKTLHKETSLFGDNNDGITIIDLDETDEEDKENPKIKYSFMLHYNSLREEFFEELKTDINYLPLSAEHYLFYYRLNYNFNYILENLEDLNTNKEISFSKKKEKMIDIMDQLKDVIGRTKNLSKNYIYSDNNENEDKIDNNDKNIDKESDILSFLKQNTVNHSINEFYKIFPEYKRENNIFKNKRKINEIDIDQIFNKIYFMYNKNIDKNLKDIIIKETKFKKEFVKIKSKFKELKVALEKQYNFLDKTKIINEEKPINKITKDNLKESLNLDIF